MCVSETVAMRLWFKLLSLISVLCLTSSNWLGYILFFSLDNCMPCKRQVMRGLLHSLIMQSVTFVAYTFVHSHCMLLSLGDQWTVLYFLEDKQNCKFGGVVSQWIRITFVYKTCVNCIKLLQFMVILYVGSSGLGIIKKGGWINY